MPSGTHKGRQNANMRLIFSDEGIKKMGEWEMDCEIGGVSRVSHRGGSCS